MRSRTLRKSARGGVLLDLVVATALIIVGAFALESLGISFGEILSGALRFFGL
jgi:hypothetical protein